MHLARVGPVKRGSVLRRDMGDETVLYDSKTGAVHALNPTASLVWDLCDGEHSLEAMEENGYLIPGFTKGLRQLGQQQHQYLENGQQYPKPSF